MFTDIVSALLILLAIGSVAYQIHQRRRGRAEPPTSDSVVGPLDGHGVGFHDSNLGHGDCGDHGGGDFGGDCGGGDGGGDGH